MKHLCFLAALSMGPALTAQNAALADVKTVYLLPMTSSLDQFLAIRLTRGGIMQVVTDPKLADAILTDQIGTNFEQKLNTLYGEQKDANAGKDDKDKDRSPPSFAGPMAGSSRTKGAVFLIDRRTRSVLWSVYVPPKNTHPEQMNHVADKIANQLEKDRKGKPEIKN